MDLKLTWDDSQLRGKVPKWEKRTVFGVIDGLNNTAKTIQQAEFAHVRSKFQIRKPAFFFGTPGRPGGVAARISPFASIKQGTPYVEISVSAGSQASQRRTLLGEFEEGGTRKPFTPGAKASAVPVTGRPARPSFAREVPPQYRFSALRFTAFRVGKKLKRSRRARGPAEVGIFGEFGRVQLPLPSKGLQWKGRERTFITHTPRLPFGGVFQRFGPGRNDVRIIYAFLPPFQLDSRLEFITTARATAQTFFEREMRGQVALALALHGDVR